MRSGTAVFAMPSGPIKCAGAPQKIAYLAADYWRQQGVLSKIRIVMVLPTPGMFGVKEFSDELERVVARYGIEVRFNSEVTTVNPGTRTVTITDNAADTTAEVGYDNAAFFRRLFKRTTGLKPADYRRLFSPVAMANSLPG